MDFGLHFLNQLPRPWDANSELNLFQNALAQVELADTLGYGYVWAVEQHFLEEYSHLSAPEVFLAAASQRTSNIRLGHSVVLMPPGYNEPARVAERISTLDLVSNGRVDFGIGNSKSRMELEGFGIDRDRRGEMSREALEQVANMMAMEPYPGYEGTWFSMPARNVIPKPVQRPHPPLWIACSDDATMHLAAQLGIGVLAHGFLDPAEAERIVDDYYETFKRECVPIGHAVNPNVAMLNNFYCHADAEVAHRRGREASEFLTYAVRHYYSFGRHRPGRTNIAATAESVRAELGGELARRGSGMVGTPSDLAEYLRTFEAAGVDQAILLHQAGSLGHQEICDSMVLFANDVMPEFVDRHHERTKRKRAELAPYVDAAFERKGRTTPLPDEAIATVDAYGRSIPPADTSQLPPEIRAMRDELERMKQVAMSREP